MFVKDVSMCLNVKVKTISPYQKVELCKILMTRCIIQGFSLESTSKYIKDRDP